MPENNFVTEELLKKAREAKTPEELIELAKNEKMELSQEKAEEYFEKLHKSSELSDDELDNVAGGGCSWFDDMERPPLLL